MKTRYKIILGIIFFALTYAALYVSPEEIAICQERTGWSADRCKVELSR